MALDNRKIPYKPRKDHNDIVGKQFGRLTVLYELPRQNDKYIRYKCICSCGKEYDTRRSALLSGQCQSCGCYRHELHLARSTTHEESKTRLYRIWSEIIQRCENPKLPTYHAYGGRGIALFDEWHKFEPFAEWAKQNGYKEDLTIERINNNGNYEPQNCRWATRKEQARNRRSSTHYFYNNHDYTIAELAELSGLKYATIHRRLVDLGWSVEKALTTPVSPCGGRHAE